MHLKQSSKYVNGYGKKCTKLSFLSNLPSEINSGTCKADCLFMCEILTIWALQRPRERFDR